MGRQVIRLTMLLGMVAVALLLVPTITSAQAPTKLPVPSQATQEQSLALIREIYKDDYANAKTDQQKAALARKLMQKARETQDDPASRFVLLKVARDLAAQAGEADAAFQAIDQMEAFDIDARRMKVDVLKKAAKAASTGKQYEGVVTLSEKLMDDMVAADTFDPSDELGDIALSAAREARNKDLIKQVVARNKEVQEIVRAYDQVKAAKGSLETNPGDPKANLIVGKYLCFTKGDWAKGIPMLALGADEKLKALAVKELKGVSGADAQAALGDGWWDLAENEEAAKQRADYWYRRALPGLTGLAREKVERRIGEVAKDAAQDSGVASTPRNKVAEAIVGMFQVIGVEKKSHKRKGFFWEFKEDYTVVENGQHLGRWKTADSQVVLSFSDSSLGEAVVKRKARDIFTASNTQQNGESWVMEMRRLVVVAVWQHKAGNDRPWSMKLWSNGRVGKPDGKATWQLKGNQLTLKWPAGWVDRCTISPDGRFYKGRNQNGVHISGTLESGN